MSTIGDKIRKERIKKGYSQEYVATILNVDQKTFGHYESGKTKISAENLVKIADILEIPIQNLLPESHAPTNNIYDQKGGNAFNLIVINNDDTVSDSKKLPDFENRLTTILQNIQELLEKLPKK